MHQGLSLGSQLELGVGDIPRKVHRHGVEWANDLGYFETTQVRQLLPSGWGVFNTDVRHQGWRDPRRAASRTSHEEDKNG